MADRIGIIGVGEIAKAMVEGLCTDPDQHAPDIVLSPRSPTVSTALAERFDTVTVADDHQGVVDGCDVLILAVPPTSAAVLAELDLPDTTVLISVLAGVSHAELARHTGRPVTIVRAIPMPSTATRTCLTPVFPGHPAASAIFDRLGGTTAVDTSGAFASLAAVSGVMSSHMNMLAVLGDWVATHGMARAEADHYVRRLFVGAGQVLASQDTPLADMVAAHETAGGLNEQMRVAWFDATEPELRAGLDGVYDRISRSEE